VHTYVKSKHGALRASVCIHNKVDGAYKNNKKNDLDLATSVASILHGSVLQSGLGGWC
jgi:hypothetical protein